MLPLTLRNYIQNYTAIVGGKYKINLFDFIFKSVEKFTTSMFYIEFVLVFSISVMNEVSALISEKSTNELEYEIDNIYMVHLNKIYGMMT